jgi:3-(3-hydroxy-phenyl)propionate hydroxylase/flavoprotein hydroxylase
LLVIGEDDPLDYISATQRAALSQIDLRVIRLSEEASDIPGVYRDVSGKYHRFMDEAGITALIVRPDFYLFGGVARIDRLPGLLDDLLDQLRPQPSRQPNGDHLKAAVS